MQKILLQDESVLLCVFQGYILQLQGTCSSFLTLVLSKTRRSCPLSKKGRFIQQVFKFKVRCIEIVQK